MAKIRSQQLNPNFTGSFNVSGSFGITGPLTATTFVGMLSSSAQIESEISGSTTAVSGGLAGRIAIIEGNVGAQDLNTTATPTFAGLNLTNNTSITGSLTVSGDVSGSSTSTASFGHFTGDGSGLTRVFEGTAASASISTRLTSFSDGTATLISGSSTSTGSFGRVESNGVFVTGSNIEMHSDADTKLRIRRNQHATSALELSYRGSTGPLIHSVGKELDISTDTSGISLLPSNGIISINDNSEQTTKPGALSIQKISGINYLAVASNSNSSAEGDIFLITGSNGNVGIANKDPQEKLDVTGNIQASGNISGSSTSTGSFGQVRGTKNAIFGLHPDIDDMEMRTISLGSRPNNGTIATLGFDTGHTYKQGIDFTGTSGALRFWGYNGSTFVNHISFLGGSSLSTNNLVVSGSKVGIGTDSPEASLEVVGDGFFTGNIRTAGDIIAENYIVSSSVVHLTQSFSSGSTIFGDTADDVHEFIGDTISGSSTSTGSFGQLNIKQQKIYEKSDDLVLESTPDHIVFRTGANDGAALDKNGSFIIGRGATVPATNHSGGHGSLTVYNSGVPIIKIANSTTGQDANSGTDLMGISDEFLIINREAGDIRLKTNNNNFIFDGVANTWSGSASSTGSFGSVHVPDRIGVDTVTPKSQLHIFRNDSITHSPQNASGGKGILLEQAGSGDAVLEFLTTGETNYIMGIDNSDSDAFKITQGQFRLGDGTTHFRYGKTGRLSLLGTDARLGVGSDPDLQFHVEGYGQLSNRLRVGHTTSTIPDAMLDVHGDAIITGSLTTEGNVSGSSTSTGSFGELKSTTATIPNLQGNVALSPTNVAAVSIGSDARWITLDGTNYSGGSAYTVDGTLKAGHYWETSLGTENYLRHQGIANNTGHKFSVRDGSGNYLHHFFQPDGNVEFVGNVSSSASSTASFGHFIGDGSGLENVFEGTAPSASISTRLTNTEATASSFIDGTAVLVSGSAISTGSFGRLEADVVEAKQFVISSSVTNMVTIDVSGSTDFGDTGDDTHRFTGSIFVQSGSISQELHTVTNSDRMFFGRSTRGIRVSGSSNISRFATDGSGNTIDLGYTTVDGNGKTVLTAVGDGIHNDLTNYWYNNNFFRVGTGGELDGANFQGLNSQYVHYDLDSLRVKGDIIATTGSLQGEVFINSPSGSSMFIGKFTGGIPVSGSDNISRYATGSDGSTVDLGFTTLDGDGNSVIVTTGDGIYVDDNNYWYTTGHFKVGSSTNQLNWNTTDLSFTGPLTASGDLVPSVHNTYDLGADSYRWANIYTADLQLSNENATPNEIDGTTGSWTIQEGEDDLYLLNRKNGKKYRFKLEEIE